MPSAGKKSFWNFLIGPWLMFASWDAFGGDMRIKALEQRVLELEGETKILRAQLEQTRRDVYPRVEAAEKAVVEAGFPKPPKPRRR
jgi:hypothetical protein